MYLKIFRKNLYVVFFSVISLLLPLRCSSQCRTNDVYLKTFDWVVKTFKEYDAGYVYYLEQKGAADIEKQTALCREKIERATSEAEAIREVNAWLFHFRKGHTGLFPKSSVSDGKTRKINITEAGFRQYLNDNPSLLHPIEGIWETKDFIVGIQRDKSNTSLFRVFMLNDKKGYGYPLYMHIADCMESDNGEWQSVFFVKNREVESSFCWLGQSKGVIFMQRMYWIKQTPEIHFSPQDDIYRMQIGDKPFILTLDKNTLYLRIHSFKIEEKAYLDRLLQENDSKIRSTSNLIIDIRNGTGGSDFTHSELLTYYYTQPIRIPNQSFYATELSVKTYEQYATEYKDNPELAEYYRGRANVLREYVGRYEDVPFASVINRYKVSAYPERVAIIFNRRNASADEGFLYAARQSYKVKLFGEPTAGAFNVSNVATVDSPDGKYTLWIAQSVSKVFPDYMIDDIGIQPDFYIDKEIEDWIEYTRSVIEAR